MLSQRRDSGDNKGSAGGRQRAWYGYGMSELRFQATAKLSTYRRTRTRLDLQTSILPRVMAEYHPGKLATTEMRQPLILGSLRVTLVLDASGPERATAFVPTSTATAVAETARPFTTVSVVAEYRSVGRAAEEPLGACAGDSLGPDVGAPVGNGAGAVSDELGAAVSDELGADSFGATTGGVDAAGSSGTTREGAGGAVGTVSTGWLGATSVSASACDSAALDHNVTAKATATRTLSSRVKGCLKTASAMTSNPSEGR
jgi:hypothetical protein